MIHRPTWDQYFLDIATATAARSKDPSTRVGCVITSSDHVQLTAGYNGFPRGVDDADERLADRPTRLAWTVHAEANAIANAAARGIALRDGTAYGTPLAPCVECAKLLIQAGIAEVVVAEPLAARLWPDAQTGVVALNMLLEADVAFIVVAPDGKRREITTTRGAVATELKLEWESQWP